MSDACMTDDRLPHWTVILTVEAATIPEILHVLSRVDLAFVAPVKIDREAEPTKLETI